MMILKQKVLFTATNFRGKRVVFCMEKCRRQDCQNAGNAGCAEASCQYTPGAQSTFGSVNSAIPAIAHSCSLQSTRSSSS